MLWEGRGAARLTEAQPSSTRGLGDTAALLSETAAAALGESSAV